MHKLIQFIFILSLITISSCKKNNECIGDGIYIGDIKLTTQLQIDSFAEFKYERVDGYFQITAFEAIDLSSLCSIKSIDRLSIFAKELTSLNGLNNIKEMDGLRILGCENLTNISEFKNLEKLNHLTISNCNNLESISSFENITSLINFELSSNYKLINIDGFSNLKRTYNTFFIYYNNSLIDLNGFQNLYYVEGYFEILYNSKLVSLNGLEKLSYVRRNSSTSNCNSLVISANPSLIDFCALQNLVELDCPDTPYNHPIYIFEDNAYNPSRLDIISGNCSL